MTSSHGLFRNVKSTRSLLSSNARIARKICCPSLVAKQLMLLTFLCLVIYTQAMHVIRVRCKPVTACEGKGVPNLCDGPAWLCLYIVSHISRSSWRRRAIRLARRVCLLATRDLSFHLHLAVGRQTLHSIDHASPHVQGRRDFCRGGTFIFCAKNDRDLPLLGRRHLYRDMHRLCGVCGS